MYGAGAGAGDADGAGDPLVFWKNDQVAGGGNPLCKTRGWENTDHRCQTLT